MSPANPDAKATAPDVRPIVLQSPKKGLSLVYKMGDTDYYPGGAWRVKTKPQSIDFDRGVCSVTREKWEALGFESREACLKMLRQWVSRGGDFVIREDLEKLGVGRSTAETPTTRVPID